MHRLRNQYIGFSCICAVFGSGGVFGGVYCMMHPIYNAVPFCGPQLLRHTKAQLYCEIVSIGNAGLWCHIVVR